MGGTESFKANLVIGKALPYAKAIKNMINLCFNGNIIFKVRNIF